MTYRDQLRTADTEGRRLWVYAEIFKGYWRNKRAPLAWILITLFLILPWLRFNHLPVVQLDFLSQRLILFGQVYWPHELALFAPLIIAFILFLFGLTALFGRVWCGWACPQTIYLEFIFRPIENWLEGSTRERKLLDSSPLNFKKLKIKSVKWAIYFGISFVIANSFLAYFVGSHRLLQIVQSPPTENIKLFILVIGVTGFFLFNFGWFREQMCSITCPYGRLQSIMTDKNTPTIGYDRVRGEPRRKISKDAQKTGDCVDCFRCVQVCPAGIDIRDGIQLECIQCAACSDACNFVMAKLGRPKNLIGYTTEQKMLGLPTTPVAKRHRYYLLVSLILIIISVYRISGRSAFDIEVARSSAVQFESTPSGIENRVQLTIENKTQKEIDISFESTKSEMKITTPLQNYRIPPNSKTQVIAFISLPLHLFKLGLAEERINVKEKNGETKAVLLHLFGPQK